MRRALLLLSQFDNKRSWCNKNSDQLLVKEMANFFDNFDNFDFDSLASIMSHIFGRKVLQVLFFVFLSTAVFDISNAFALLSLRLGVPLELPFLEDRLSRRVIDFFSFPILLLLPLPVLPPPSPVAPPPVPPPPLPLP